MIYIYLISVYIAGLGILLDQELAGEDADRFEEQHNRTFGKREAEERERLDRMSIEEHLRSIREMKDFLNREEER